MPLIPINLYEEIFPNLNVAEIDVVEGAAGPGRRFVVWLQGCLKRCPGCANADFLPERVGSILSVENLLAMLDECRGCDGVTLSGGEPVLQAEALTPFIKRVRNRGLTVMSYSGYTLAELTDPDQHPSLKEFLKYVDLLVDGEYRQELSRAGIYRPSSNQRLHFLSGRVSSERLETSTETVVDIRGASAYITGTLPKEIRRKLFEKLRAEGLNIKSR